MRILSFLAMATALFGPACRHTPQPRRTHYVDAEYAPYKDKGTGAVSGQAFARTRGGDVKYPAGCTVILNPVTSYSTEWWQRTVVEGELLADPDERAAPFNRQTTADGQGKFDELPPGEYYVVCGFQWEIPTGGYLTRTTGAMLGSRVQLAVGERKELILPVIRTW